MESRRTGGHTDTPECCQNFMCFMPTVTNLSVLKGLLFTTKIFSLWPLQHR